MTGACGPSNLGGSATFMLVDEQDYEEVIEEYEEEILVQEGVSEPFVVDFTDPSPAQGKPRCITPIFTDH